MTTQVAYSIIEEQEIRIKRVEDDYMSFVAVLADPRYCGKSIYRSCFNCIIIIIIDFSFDKKKINLNLPE
jgi:hypothetical protein